MTNPPPASAIQQRRSSRSHSTSSSVVTVKKAASLSSRSGSRRPQKSSTNDLDSHGPPLESVSSLLPVRNSGSRSRPSSALGSTVSSNVNINRWSHSTTSSAAGVENDPVWQRSSSPLKQSSASPAPPTTFTMSPSKARAAAGSAERSSQTRKSPKLRPQSKDTQGSKVQAMPPRRINHIAQAYYGPKAKSPSTRSTTPLNSELLTASTPETDTRDYFGETWEPPAANFADIDGDNAKSIHYSITSSPGGELGPGRAVWSKAVPLSHVERSPDPGHRAGHTRHRERSAKGSTGTNTGSSVSSVKSDQSRGRGHRSPGQKAMLAKALSKANTAVWLDNAESFEDAAEAYAEACDLLQQVTLRSSDIDDRKKLSAIKATYSNRIAELRDTDMPFNNFLNKALPEMPALEDDIGEAYYEDDMPMVPPVHARTLDGVSIPPRLESMLPTDVPEEGSSRARGHLVHQMASQPSSTRTIAQTSLLIPMRTEYMPPPLSPRRPPSPAAGVTADSPRELDPPVRQRPQHDRAESTESTSWLDTVDESASSTASSRLSSLDFGAGISDNLASEIEASFDAAMNAAVESAYEDDRTPVGGTQRSAPPTASSASTISLSESLQPSISTMSTVVDTSKGLDLQPVEPEPAVVAADLSDNDSDEEERLLDEMTREYILNDFHFDKRSKSALPRQSDSSSFSGRTWGSSVASTTATSGTTLSTLAEAIEMPMKVPPTVQPRNSVSRFSVPPVPSMPPPPAPSSRPSSMEKSAALGVRDRRLSGQNAKQLKIETFVKAPFSADQTGNALPMISVPMTEAKPASGLTTGPQTPITSAHSAESGPSESPAARLPAHAGSQSSVDETVVVSPSSGRHMNKMKIPQPVLRKNVSSSSLKLRNPSVTASEADSPLTPGSGTFPPETRKPYAGMPPPMPTPTGNSFSFAAHSIGGMYLFDDEIGHPTSPRTPRTPNTTQVTTPLPLEPCPESFLLRPFWLMRTLYQTIAHPRGGYLTTKLFVPRDIWRVKNVKLKAVEDKISQCDLLTAALLKLGNVDNLDADAVLEELQSFEAVIEQVRIYLQKKLGAEVGLSGSSSLFKGSAAGEGPADATDGKNDRASNSAKNSFASSWRKLRSKSSGAGINATYSALAARDPGAAASLSMATLPMKASSNPVSARSSLRRTPLSSISLQGMGSNTNYMSSLAKLFDSAQTLDQIARQVEDPGLKFTSKTQVGLELSVRIAAEFFAFYILRFVVGDITIMLDKFVKRGTEWVLA